MHELTIKVPASIHEAIEVWSGAQLITEPLGVTELKQLLAMTLRHRLMEKRNAGEGGNFHGATDNKPPHG